MRARRMASLPMATAPMVMTPRAAAPRAKAPTARRDGMRAGGFAGRLGRDMSGGVAVKDAVQNDAADQGDADDGDQAESGVEDFAGGGGAFRVGFAALFCPALEGSCFCGQHVLLGSGIPVTAWLDAGWG